MGIESSKRTMHVIEIWNDLRTTIHNKNKGSYGYHISRKMNPKNQTVMWHKTGTVVDFPRSAKNAVHLLLAVLKDAYE